MSTATSNQPALPVNLSAQPVNITPGPGTPTAGGRRWLVRALRSVLVLWAGGWCLFAVLAALDEGSTAIPYAAGFLTAIVGPVVLAWRYPRFGGVVLAAVGVGSMFFFNDLFTQATLGAPAILLGLCSVVVGRRSA